MSMKFVMYYELNNSTPSIVAAVNMSGNTVIANFVYFIKTGNKWENIFFQIDNSKIDLKQAIVNTFNCSPNELKFKQFRPYLIEDTKNWYLQNEECGVYVTNDLKSILNNQLLEKYTSGKTKHTTIDITESVICDIKKEIHKSAFVSKDAMYKIILEKYTALSKETYESIIEKMSSSYKLINIKGVEYFYKKMNNIEYGPMPFNELELNIYFDLLKYKTVTIQGFMTKYHKTYAEVMKALTTLIHTNHTYERNLPAPLKDQKWINNTYATYQCIPYVGLVALHLYTMNNDDTLALNIIF